MEHKRRFHTKIENGKTLCSDNIRNAIKDFEGMRVIITIEKAKKTRSLQQNSFYWGVVIKEIKEFLFELGNVLDQEEVHEYIKRHVLKLPEKTVNLPTGEIIKLPGTTKILTTKQWEDNMEIIRAHFAPWGLQVSFPERSYYE